MKNKIIAWVCVATMLFLLYKLAKAPLSAGWEKIELVDSNTFEQPKITKIVVKYTENEKELPNVLEDDRYECFTDSTHQRRLLSGARYYEP